jgi:hypothetical protein
MLNISEVLDDRDFVETVTFLLVQEDGTEKEVTHATTNVQPATANALQRLDVLERSKPYMQVFTKTSCPIKNGDYMIYNNEKWRCVTDEDWSRYGYYDGIFVRYVGASDVDSEVPNPLG